MYIGRSKENDIDNHDCVMKTANYTENKTDTTKSYSNKQNPGTFLSKNTHPFTKDPQPQQTSVFKTAPPSSYPFL